MGCKRDRMMPRTSEDRRSSWRMNTPFVNLVRLADKDPGLEPFNGPRGKV
jgi:hypothetical protein